MKTGQTVALKIIKIEPGGLGGWGTIDYCAMESL